MLSILSSGGYCWVRCHRVRLKLCVPFFFLDSIDSSVSRFWQLEEVPNVPVCSDEDKRCEELFAQTTRRDMFGRFVVSYPFEKDKPCFVDSHQISVNRFRSPERRFKLDPEFRVNYHKFMQDYLDSGNS